MEAKQWTTVDKANWGDGAWQSEPDKMQWQDPATGLPCLIVRGPGGALCGYAGVAPSHPWHSKDYSALDGEDIDVHGGLTFANGCAGGPDESRGVCHVPTPGEPDHVWWFGFDCAHCWDFSPRDQALYGGDFRDPDAIYRDVAYVQAQVATLAKQLTAAAP